jgi:hypothetical protein
MDIALGVGIERLSSATFNMNDPGRGVQKVVLNFEQMLDSTDAIPCLGLMSKVSDFGCLQNSLAMELF